jgi:flagellar hook protein FlgE
MASTSSLFTGLSGLGSNSRRLDVIGNNISNVNTVAFKSNRLNFAPSFSRNLSLGSSPNGANGGTNPAQVGVGVTAAATQRNFANGALSTTGVPTDLAIEGDGFFIVEREGVRSFTRDGAFQLNANNELVSTSGARVQGFAVDDEFNLVEGGTTGLSIPLGVTTIAEATTNVQFSGNFNADGDVATTGSIHTFDAWEVAGPTPATGASLLADVLTVPAFTNGDVLRIEGAEVGGKTIPAAELTLDPATTTVQDVLDFFQDALGVIPGAIAGGTGSVTIDGTGQIVVTGNYGELNELTLDANFFDIVDGTTGTSLIGGLGTFNPTQTQEANGESVRTTFVVYDSLGTPLNVDVTAVLQDTGPGTSWRLYLRSADDIEMGLGEYFLDSGGTPIAPELQFDEFGELITSSPINITLDRFDTGARDPLSFDLTFNAEGGSVTALSSPNGAEGVSTLASTFQDGSPLGVLTSFAVGTDGTITGGFTNGLTRTIGQVAIANFTNPEGLIDAGENMFQVGPNSGTPLVTTPTEFGAGRVIGGALELSNVDLSQEFINLILTSTGYSASSRVISTSDELLRQLIATAR